MNDKAINVPLVSRDDINHTTIIRPSALTEGGCGPAVSFQRLQNSESRAAANYHDGRDCSSSNYQDLAQPQSQQQAQNNFVDNNLKNGNVNNR